MDYLYKIFLIYLTDDGTIEILINLYALIQLFSYNIVIKISLISLINYCQYFNLNLIIPSRNSCSKQRKKKIDDEMAKYQIIEIALLFSSKLFSSVLELMIDEDLN